MTRETALSPSLLGYLLGSIPFGLLLTRLGGKGDVRDIGSGNIGATNVLRTGSKGLAALTLLLDCLKATAAILLAAALVGPGIGDASPPPARCSAISIRSGSGSRAARASRPCSACSIAAAADRRGVYAAVWLGLLLTIRISSVAGMAAALSAPITAAVLGDQHRFPDAARFRAARAVEAPREHRAA